jgi:uncharacterized membrane protein YfcA
VDALQAIAILAAGIGAGTINTVVGSGTLITFPVLLAFGYPPVVANVSNSIGLVPGSVSGAIGYRRELAGQWNTAIRYGLITFAGALLGAATLLLAPASAFEVIVPFFIAVALVLVVFQPRIAAWLDRRRAGHDRLAQPGVFVVGVYGGYFGAAQGILLLALLGLTVRDELQRVNALKNVLAGLNNLTGGLVFAVAADVDWSVAALLAVGSAFGGQIGAAVGRRLPSSALRALIVLVGITAIVQLIAN